MERECLGRRGNIGKPNWLLRFPWASERLNYEWSRYLGHSAPSSLLNDTASSYIVQKFLHAVFLCSFLLSKFLEFFQRIQSLDITRSDAKWIC